ncbi:IS30 family transposase [Cryobacterium sp. Y29]|uniref:IS30 family transposase n=1 Tax=Cryobacterium sp. Y29 TaxID=2048285 RepID=UPI0011B08C3A|nr:IS30 family transposase [Cryobacterium sp. Y29]
MADSSRGLQRRNTCIILLKLSAKLAYFSKSADTLVLKVGALPAAMGKSLTWNRGKELSQHVELAQAAGIADAQTSWQRPLNENTNGLLRQYFPKGTNFTRWDADELDAVAVKVNDRPRENFG